MKNLTELLQSKVGEQIQNLITIINNAKHESITVELVEQFSKAFGRLKHLESVQRVSEYTNRQLELISQNLEIYIFGQKSLLMRVTEDLEKNSQSLSLESKHLQAAIDNIETLSKFGNEGVQAEATNAKKSAARKMGEALEKIV